MKELSILELIAIKNDCLQNIKQCEAVGSPESREEWGIKCDSVQEEIDLRYKDIFN